MPLIVIVTLPSLSLESIPYVLIPSDYITGKAKGILAEFNAAVTVLSVENLFHAIVVFGRSWQVDAWGLTLFQFFFWNHM